MNVSFAQLRIGSSYTRKQLAELWGYRGYQALARGVVTPSDSHLIILFVTENKSADRVPYADRLAGQELWWEGPTDHFAETRMLDERSSDEIHLFYRESQRSDFEYKGRCRVVDSDRHSHEPSKFYLRLIDLASKRVAETPERYGKDWSRDELIVAFNLYCQIPFGTIHMRNPNIIALAKTLKRSVGSVSIKLANLSRYDPELQKRGIVGLSHGAKLEAQIWEEFYSEPEKLAFESECKLARLLNRPIGTLVEKDTVDLNDYKGASRARIVRTRINQRFFRQTVLAAYNFQCAITGLPIKELVEACHIVPWSANERLRMDPRNGLPLNSLHHNAFDHGLLFFDASMKVRFGSKLPKATNEDEAAALDWMMEFEGCKLREPKRFFPDPKCLEWHRLRIAGEPF